MAPLARIPIHRGCDRWKCGTVVAYAIVDDADLAELQKYHWTLKDDGYAVRSYPVAGQAKQAAITMHRQVLGLERYDPRQGDHINGDRLDNRRSNLRVVTIRENGQNKRPFRTSKSGLRGVAPEGRRWRAYCQNRCLGFFDTKEEAAAVAQAERLRVMAGAVD